MGDNTLNDIKKLIEDLQKDINGLKTSQNNLQKDINELKTSQNNLQKDINELKTSQNNLKEELKQEIKDLKKESANTNYRLEMLQSKSNKPNNFLDALSPAAAVGSKYHKTNSFYSE